MPPNTAKATIAAIRKPKRPITSAVAGACVRLRSRLATNGGMIGFPVPVSARRFFLACKARPAGGSQGLAAVRDNLDRWSLENEGKARPKKYVIHMRRACGRTFSDCFDQNEDAATGRDGKRSAFGLAGSHQMRNACPRRGGGACHG